VSKLSLQRTADYKATNGSVKPAHAGGLYGIRYWLRLAALAGPLVFVVLFWRLGTPTFWDPDEAHYAQTAREMMASGDWWAPYFNEEPFYDKPVLFHQLQGAAMLAFGPTEFAARLVPALAALALILITVWFGLKTASRDVGITAGLLLTASPGVFALSRYAILDTVFTAAVFGGAAMIAVAALYSRPPLQWWGYVAVGVGVLTKGPIALVLCGVALVIASTLSGDARRRLLRLHWVLGLLLAVLMALPWFVYMFVRFRDTFVNVYFLDENIRLFAGRRFGNQPRPWFYFQILAAGLLPWTGIAAGRLVDDVRAAVRGEAVATVEVLLWSWSAAIVGFFTLSTFKLDHYVFPAAPALCLLCARAWADVRSNPLDSRHAGARAGLYLVGPFLVVLGIGCGYFLIARLELPRLAAVVPVVITFAGVLVSAIINVQARAGRQLPRHPWIALAALMTTYAGIILFVMPALEARKVVPEVARWVAAHAGDDVRIATYRLNRWNPAFRFYVNRHASLIDDPREAEAFFQRPAPFYCVMRRAAFQEFAAQGLPLTVVYAREGLWATSGRALWRRRIPPEQFVVVSKRPAG
jgi:4-amino-4-deoxy-L-arabinose transferase-like glycosyltransferase